MNYEEVHKGLIDRLRIIGIAYPYNVRLDLFWLRTTLMKNYFSPKEMDEQQACKEAVEHIDTLVEMCKAGLEPEHRDGRYVSLS